jgi:hypothetical protein
MPRIVGAGLLVTAIAACANQSASTPSTHGRGAPNAETQQISFDLVKATLTCFQARRPSPGKVVMGAEFYAPGSPIHVFDSESTPGNEDAIRCAIEKGNRLSSPPSPPSRFLVYEIVFPGGPEDIRFNFPQTSPPRRSP